MTMLRRICLWLLCGLLLTCSAFAEDGPAPLQCREDRIACQVLQMVMRGDFSSLDETDSLSVRVHAAVLPWLLSLTEEDTAHLLAEYQADGAMLQLHLHIAMGNCLWADILTAPRHEDARQQAYREVLLLFLRPAATPRDMEDKATIRSQLTEDFLTRMAEETGLSLSFLEHIFYSDDWREACVPASS